MKRISDSEEIRGALGSGRLLNDSSLLNKSVSQSKKLLSAEL